MMTPRPCVQSSSADPSYGPDHVRVLMQGAFQEHRAILESIGSCKTKEVDLLTHTAKVRHRCVPPLTACRARAS